VKVPVTGKVYEEQDVVAMIQCLQSGEEITYGSWNTKFEKMLRDYVGTKYAYFVNSGSSANLLAMAALFEIFKVASKDEIITVAAGFPTTIAPIIQLGAMPVFIDIKADTYNVDLDQLKKALSPRTKGVVLAHTLGNPFDIVGVREFCTRHGLFLLEDNADALGSTYGGKKTGSFGDVSIASFYPAHHLTTGQGGAVFTNDPATAKVLLSLRNWGKDCVCQPNQDGVCWHRFDQSHGTLPIGYDHKYVFSRFGYNLQGTNLLAALGCSQMERIKEFTENRHTNYKYLYDTLSEMNLPIKFARSLESAVPSWFGFPIMLPRYLDRNSVCAQLNQKGIGTRNLFAGNILRQPCFAKKAIAYRQVSDLSITDSVMNSMFWIGCWHGLSKTQLDYSIQSLEEVLNG